MSTPPITLDLLQSLFSPCVFLKWPRGMKGDKRKWKHLTLDDLTPEYLSDIMDGNIGIALGRVSNGLCAIDFDDDDLVAPFRAANPWTVKTTITKGARGCQIWVRIVGDFPPTTKLKRNGIPCGEWRTDGSQSIIPPSIHPDTNQPYLFLSIQPVVSIHYNEINYPEGMVGTSKVSSMSTQPTQLTQMTEFTQYTQLCSKDTAFAVGTETRSDKPGVEIVPNGRPALDIEQLVSPYIATARGRNNKNLFELAKAVVCARLLDYDVSDQEVFAVWWRHSQQHTRPNLTADSYFTEFKKAFAGIKGDPLIDALRASHELAAPGSDRLLTERARRFAAFCYCLRDGKGEFFLSCRAAGKTFLIPHKDAGKWIEDLIYNRILETVVKGSKQTAEATVFRFIGEGSG